MEGGDISNMNLSYEPESDVESLEEGEHQQLQDLHLQEQHESLGLKTVREPEPSSSIEATAAPVSQQQQQQLNGGNELQPPAQIPQQQLQQQQQVSQTKFQEPAAAAAAAAAPVDNLPAGTAPVDGFQLVQATGLTDTSTPAPRGSEIPTFATATPIPDLLPRGYPASASPASSYAQSNPLPPVPAAPMPRDEASNPLSDESKSKQFNARTDYMISEFFSRQVSRLTRGAPEALDRSYRVFQQRFKERLGAQWAHITSQPEVEEAIKRVQEMYDYFEGLEKLVGRQKTAIVKVNDCETELSLWYRKEGISEPAGSIRDNMLYLSQSYHDVCIERSLLIAAYEQYAEFLEVFKKKAIGDALDTMKKQHAARLELDAYGSKLGQLEEKKLKTFARAPSARDGSALEKELTSTRTRFQEAKNNYQNQSTALIDKAGLLDLKKGVDFAAHIQKIRNVHDAFNKGRVGATTAAIPDEEDVVDDYMLAHGVPRPTNVPTEESS